MLYFTYNRSLIVSSGRDESVSYFLSCLYREESKLNVSVATLGCYKNLNVNIQANSRVKKAWQWGLLEQSHQFHSATTPRAAHCWKSPHDWGVKKKKPAWFISCWRLLLFVGECEIEMSTELIDISSSSIFSHTWNANTNSELFWPQSCLFHSPEVFFEQLVAPTEIIEVKRSALAA